MVAGAPVDVNPKTSFIILCGVQEVSFPTTKVLLKDMKRTRGRLDRNVSPCSMNAIKCVHAQKPYPSQAIAHESSKVGRREKREEERQERQKPGG